MKISQQFIDAYQQAQASVESLLGSAPDDYKVLLFVDPTLYDSVLLQTTHAGTPKAMISSNDLYILQEMQNDGYVASGRSMFYGGRSPRLFFPQERITSKLEQEVVKAKLVKGLSQALLCEQTVSSFPDTLKKLYRQDTIIYDLFANNVYEFVMERGAPWVWQYFQDFTAVIRLLSLYDLDDFYVPPSSVRNASIFYNYLLEIKNIIKERAKTTLKTPLYDLVLHGMGDIVLNEYLQTMDETQQEQIIPYLKAELGQPMGVAGARFLREYGEDLEAIYETARSIPHDQELTKIWNRGDTKDALDEERENLSNRSVVWHSAKDSYWSDLWPMRASRFDKVGNYIGKIQRRGYKSFSELQKDSPVVTSHGRIRLRDREVAVLGIQEDTVGQEQLIVLRNHLEAKKETFSTPLPGLPDIIVFKKYAGMHVASYLGVVDDRRSRSYPKSPYDLPVVVRAIQVSSRKEAYQSSEREEDARIDQVDYEGLHSLTDPQHRALRYLIRQREVQQ